MRFLRLRLTVFLFFGLISLGQAYPFSFVWASAQHAECGCNQSGRKCIHGCAVKKKQAAVQHAHDHAQRAVKGKGCHSEPDSTWVSPNCSQQKILKVVTFSGDPFLLPVFQYRIPCEPSSFSIPVRFDFAGFIPALDPPPPRSA